MLEIHKGTHKRNGLAAIWQARVHCWHLVGGAPPNGDAGDLSPTRSGGWPWAPEVCWRMNIDASMSTEDELADSQFSLELDGLRRRLAGICRPAPCGTRKKVPPCTGRHLNCLPVPCAAAGQHVYNCWRATAGSPERRRSKARREKRSADKAMHLPSALAPSSSSGNSCR